MPDLLGPANPVPGYTNTGVKIPPPLPGDAVVQNIVDLDHIVRPDGRTDQQDAGGSASHAMR